MDKKDNKNQYIVRNLRHDEIENMGYEECDYSVEKLKNNTVFMQAPS